MKGEMIRLLVIDDIKSVVDGIASQVPWERYGIRVIGKCLNGEEGLSIVKSLSPDIILTDIRMPKLDGLSLAEETRKLMPRCKVVLMSGYDDFEYAQRAVRLGAFDFVTKPFSLEDILEVVLKAKNAVEHEKSHLMHLQKLEQRKKESIPLLRQEYLSLLVQSGGNEDVNISNRWDFFGIELKPQDFVVMLVTIEEFTEHKIDSPVGEIELARFAIQNVLEETIANYTKFVVFRETLDRYVIIYNVFSTNLSSELADKCRKNITNFTKFTPSFGIGCPVKQIVELSLSYQQAYTALKYRFYTGGNSVISYEDISLTEHHIPRYPSKRAKELAYALQTGDKAKMIETLEQIQDELAHSDSLPNPRYLVPLLYGLANMMVRSVAEKLAYEQVKPLEEMLKELQNETNLSLQNVYTLLKKIGSTSCALVQEHSKSHTYMVIERVTVYIQQNLSADLTVNHCAKMIYLSESYFAHLFKKVTGVSFNKYVTRERIEKAKEMLIQNKQVQEIASAVGYKERRYFSDVFKKTTGLTPSEFRQKMEKTIPIVNENNEHH